MGLAHDPPTGQPGPAFPHAVRWLSLALIAVGAGAGTWAYHLHRPGGVLPPAGVVALMAAMVGAACLQLRYSYREHFEALDLFDAVLAAAIFSLTGPVVVVVAAATMAVSEVILHTRPVKAVFNVAQWVASAGTGSLCYAALAEGRSASLRNMGALAVSMVVVSVVNHVCVAAVFALVSPAEAARLRRFLASFTDRGWLLGSAANLALGLLLVAAIDTSAVAMVLFAVPLAMLHWANKGYAEGRADRARLAGLQRATHVLVGPLDPRDAVAAFLVEVRDCFGVEVAELTLLEAGGTYRVQQLRSADPATTRTWSLPAGAATLSTTLLRLGTPSRVSSQAGSAAQLLRAEGWRDCLAAPLLSKGEVRGVLCAYDRAGLAGFQAGELPVLQALASELVGALEKAELVEQVLHQALHDSLTDLPNRTLFQERVERAIADSPGDDDRLAVMLIDLNRFKEVNDTLGHHHGDLLLQDFSRRIESTLRPDDTVARLGGDEFAILIRRVADRAGAEGVVERLLHAVDEPFSLQGLPIDVDISVGIALYPEHGGDAVTLLQRADVAMYAAKAAQSGFEVYAPEKDRYSPRRLALVGELRSAAARRELEVYYQPKSCLRTGRVTGVEALLRWDHPVYGRVEPDEFIPIAEQTGSIRDLTTFVLSEALSQCAAWRLSGLDLSVAVNLSVRSLLDADLPAEIAALLRRTGIPGPSLTLELTETSMMTDPARTAEVLARLHSLGLQLSVDDYGTGYSSLAYLRHLPVDEMKIDKSFVISMDDDDDADVIVRSTVDLAHNLGLRVVAEGVETGPSWDRLVKLGCDSAQGFYVSGPVPAAAIIPLLDRLHQRV